MHKETVRYTNQQTGEEQKAEVAVFDTIDEAKKALGDQGCLEHINDALTESAQRKLRHGAQLKRAQKKRQEDKAMREYALSKGFDPAKIKVG